RVPDDFGKHWKLCVALRSQRLCVCSGNDLICMVPAKPSSSCKNTHSKTPLHDAVRAIRTEPHLHLAEIAPGHVLIVKKNIPSQRTFAAHMTAPIRPGIVNG